MSLPARGRAGGTRSLATGAKQPDCHERALRLLSGRLQSRRELERRLTGAGFDPAEVELELARLEAVGLVDDEEFARQVVDYELTARRSGRRAIAGRLAAKGVSRDTIERSLQEAGGEGDEQRALEVARDRARRLGGLAPQQAFTRLVGFLARRGYEPAVARRAAKQALEIDP